MRTSGVPVNPRQAGKLGDGPRPLGQGFDDRQPGRIAEKAMAFGAAEQVRRQAIGASGWFHTLIVGGSRPLASFRGPMAFLASRASTDDRASARTDPDCGRTLVPRQPAKTMASRAMAAKSAAR